MRDSKANKTGIHMGFIIGVDEEGVETIHTSDPTKLADFFGANPEAPNYLTKVDFLKRVLDRYYQQPSKYVVEDGILGCRSSGGYQYEWAMHIDNHHSDKVCAWLGDLGRDLPYQEQLHWRAHNIPPEGAVSETLYKRQILAQPANSDRPEHVFRSKYSQLRKCCDERLGWPLLLPLGTEDEYHIRRLRVPSTDEQHEFDELVLSLSKILVGSVNQNKISELIRGHGRDVPSGSIAMLEALLAACGIPDGTREIAFLRRVQRLRSSGTAHRKGSKYRDIVLKIGLVNKDLRPVLASMLVEASTVLEYLNQAVCSGRLRPGSCG